jgi:hypothetical protein
MSVPGRRGGPFVDPLRTKDVRLAFPEKDARQDNPEDVKQTGILVGVTTFSLVILSVDRGLRASGNSEVDSGKRGFDAPFTLGMDPGTWNNYQLKACHPE